MTKKAKVDEFQMRTYELENKLQELADDMLAYTAQCHKATVVMKRYNRIMKAKMEAFACLNAAISDMSRTVECVQGEVRA